MDIPSEVQRILSYGVDVAYDIETTGFDPRKDKLVLISIKPKDKRWVYIDCRHEEKSVLAEWLAPLLTSSVVLVGHNLLFDLHWALTYLGVAPGRQLKYWDTMLTELEILGIGLAESNKSEDKRVGMKEVGERYGIAVSKEERAWFPHLDQRPEWNLPFPEEQLAYARQDVSVVHRIKAAQEVAVRELGLTTVVDIENRTLPAVVVMSHWGVHVDVGKWHEAMGEIKKNYEELEMPLLHGTTEWEGLAKYILAARTTRDKPIREEHNRWVSDRDSYLEMQHFDYCGMQDEKHKHRDGWGQYKVTTMRAWREAHPEPKKGDNKEGVNLGSPDQLKDGFRGIGLPVPNVKEETLKPYIATVPQVAAYLKWKGYATLMERYGGDFLDRFLLDGRLYPDWVQRAAVTGRFGCKTPNLQQFPAREAGSEMRKAIVPAPGFVFVIADFSNIEARVAAELSGDPFLIEAFGSGQDLHSYVAVKLLDLDIPEGEDAKAYTLSHMAVVGGQVTKTTQRDLAKTSVYAKLFGAQANRLSALYGVPKKQGEALNQMLYETFPTAIDWIASQGKKDVVITLSGRRGVIPMPPKPEPIPRAISTSQLAEKMEEMRQWKSRLSFIERTKGNLPIQGSAADINKYALMAFWLLVGYNEDIRLLATVHDETILEVRIGFEEEAKTRLKQAMEYAQKRFLRRVSIGKVEPVVSDYWKH